jgi:hypothetical protein
MKLNKLKKAPAPRTVQAGTIEFVEGFLDSVKLFEDVYDDIKAKLVKSDKSVDNKKVVGLTVYGYETVKLFNLLKNKGFRKAEQMKNYVAELTLYNKYSLRGNISDFVISNNSNNEVNLYVKLESERNTEYLNRVIDIQIKNQDDIGESANVNLKFFPSTYPAKPAEILLIKKEDVLNSANDNDDCDLLGLPGGLLCPDYLTSEVNEVLAGSGYTAVVAEKGRGEIAASYAQFEECSIQANVNTDGELVVIMRQPRRIRKVANRVYETAANVLKNIRKAEGVALSNVFTPRNTPKNIIIEENTISDEPFLDVAQYVKNQWKNEFESDDTSTAVTKKRKSVYGRIEMGGLEVACGEITSLNYDKDGNKVEFKISNPELRDRLSDGIMFQGKVYIALALETEESGL